jgi:hypothetical protein
MPRRQAPDARHNLNKETEDHSVCHFSKPSRKLCPNRFEKLCLKSQSNRHRATFWHAADRRNVYGTRTCLFLYCEGNEGQGSANYKYPVPNGTVEIITNQQSVNYF